MTARWLLNVTPGEAREPDYTEDMRRRASAEGVNPVHV